MTTTTDPRTLLHRAIDVFGDRLDATRSDDLAASTPCHDWTVRDLIGHVVTEQLWAPPLLAGETAGDIGDRFDGDNLGDDPFAAWHDAASATRTATAPQDALHVDIHLPGRTTRGADFLLELFADHLIHAWDLARATGGDQRLPDDLVAACTDWFDGHEHEWREAGQIGPPIDVPGDADAQTRLLARFGRTQ